MSMQTIQDKIDALEYATQSFEGDFKTYIKDKDIPLDERWRVYERVIENDLYYKCKSSYWDIEKYDKHLCLHDDLCFERYQTIALPCLLERLVDCLGEDKEDLIHNIQEEFLASGYTHFVYDW